MNGVPMIFLGRGDGIYFGDGVGDGRGREDLAG
jgi:hypothetical protein